MEKVYIHAEEDCSALKRREILLQASTWMNVGDIILSEISQNKGRNIHNSTYIRYVKYSYSDGERRTILPGIEDKGRVKNCGLMGVVFQF